ncbi:MAG: UDP-glucose 4-epimerase GalE [FCB group bacterium]|nr:UDP-glucose 4-epimerase GalE [FCB group bacterium]
MKLLVTGGAGYIGSHVVMDCCDAGHDVVVYDDLSLGFRENVDPRATFIQGSTLDRERLLSLCRTGQFGGVIHLAAWKAAGESMLNPGKYLRNNLNGTYTLLDVILATGIPYFVFSSTAAVYGFPEYLPIDENHPTKPINYYGYTKLAIEKNLHWLDELSGLRFAALRYFNAAGYDVKHRIHCKERNPANLLPIVMEVASGKREFFEVFGNDYDTSDGTGVRDYIHVNDLASAHVQALNRLESSNKSLMVNLATGEGYSVLEVVKMAEEISGAAVPYKVVDRRPGDPDKLVAVSNRANELLHWKPQYSDLRTLLSSMWPLYQQNTRLKGV